MRVITGTARGRRLAAPPGTETRPTADITKEGAFSAIQFEVEGADVLDLFAGSGQMGIEALSRGARHCVFVDSSRPCRAVQQQNLHSTGLGDRARLATEEVASFLKRTDRQFDIAFLDPPYGQGLVEETLPLLAQRMRPGGVILCEIQKSENLPELVGGFHLKKRYRYGKTVIALYRHGEIA